MNNLFLLLQTGVANSIQNFMSGALIGSFLSSLFYPCNVLKVSCQSTMGGPYMSILKIFHQIYNERNRKLVNLYKGCSVNFSRAFISWGLINSSYEIFKNILY